MSKPLKTIDIKGKPYIEVNERIKEFRSNELYKGYSLESEIIQLENGICTIKAIIKDATGRVIATGYAQEKENSSFINKTSYIENCETSAWGRALGNLGIGIDTSIASAEEVLNAMANQLTNNTITNAKSDELQTKINEDFDLLEELKNKKDLPNLIKFFNENQNAAKDKAAFMKEFRKLRNEIEKGA